MVSPALGADPSGFRKTSRQPRIGGELRREVLDLARQMRTCWKPFSRQLYRRACDGLKLHHAEPFQRRVDAGDLAGYCDRREFRSARVSSGCPPRTNMVGLAFSGARSRKSSAYNCLVAAHVDEHEAAAADSGRGGIGDSHRQRGCARRIDGIAAVAQNFHARGGGLRALRDHHRAARHHRGVGGRSGRSRLRIRAPDSRGQDRKEREQRGYAQGRKRSSRTHRKRGARTSDRCRTHQGCSNSRWTARKASLGGFCGRGAVGGLIRNLAGEVL